MSLIMKERPLSRSWSEGENPTLDTEWIIGVTDSHVAVIVHMEDQLPAVWDGLVLQSYDAEPAGGGWWHGSARYGKREKREVDYSSFDFDISAGSVHVTHSLATVGAYAPEGKTAPNFRGAINVTKDGVDGVDINLPTYTFGETHYLDPAVVTEAYKTGLFYATGRVNSVPFRGLAPGECMFLGASGSKRGLDAWEVSFRFAGSPNATNIQIGDITVAEKRGWDYLWVYYADEEDTTAKSIVKRPIAAYVEQVSQYSNFAALGI